MNANICVVGAGMAGLTAANLLQQAGASVTVLDKGRGVGGRLATRRFGDARIDHGAQYFTVRDDRFQAMVDAWLTSKVVYQWSAGFPSTNGTESSGKYPRYRGANGMSDVAKALANGLNVQTSTRVQRIDYEDDAWRLTAQDVANNKMLTVAADALLMTPPAEQSLTLLDSGSVKLPSAARSALEAITYNPCFAVLALLDRDSAIPEPGGIFMPGEPISWMADNQQKGVSDVPAVTIHAGPEFTRQHFDDDVEVVAQMLIDAAREQLGDAEVIEYQVQRWRYSQPQQMHPEKTLFVNSPGPLAFAGDAFDGARVEGAALSGMAAAERLIAVLSN